MSTIAVVVGNPQPASRTALVAEEVASQLAARSGASVLPTIDLAGYAERIFAYPEAEIDELNAQVAAADLVVIASPTYKAAYTGLLKAFLDRYGAGGLSAVAAVPILTIGSPRTRSRSTPRCARCSSSSERACRRAPSPSPPPRRTTAPLSSAGGSSRSTHGSKACFRAEGRRRAATPSRT